MNRNDDIELGRRQHQRFALVVDAEVTSEGVTSAAVTRDVSRGGICFLLAEPLRAGAEFDVALQLMLSENAFSEPLNLRGIVCWCTRIDETTFQIGGSFGEFGAETAEYLDMFLKFLGQGIDVGDEEEEDEDDEPSGERDLFA